MKLFFEEYGLAAIAALGGLFGISIAVAMVKAGSPLASFVSDFFDILMGI